MTRARSAVSSWLGLLAALLVLNVALTMTNVWPTPFITIRGEVSIEIACGLLALVSYAALARRLGWPLPAKRTALALTVALFVLTVGRYAHVTAPALYGRPVNLYWDVRHLPRVAAMLAEVAKPWMVGAAAIGLIALVLALSSALYFAVARIERGLRATVERRALGAVSSLAVAAYLAGRAFGSPVQYWFSEPVLATYSEQIEFVLDARRAATARQLPIRPLAASDLAAVRGADVLLVFLESYGAAAYDSPMISAVIEPHRAALEAAAAATGRQVVSAFVRSPTFGGSSWLAHATLLSGFEVRESTDYDLLLTQNRETIPKRFAAAGYRTLAVMPGLKNPWPEGSFYGFDEILGERALDYRGPDFGWWRIPDQYALAKLDALALEPVDRAPVFVFFPTINTHIPFRPTPPYEPDWRRVLGAHPFDDAAAAASIAQSPDWTKLEGAYAESFAYTFEYLAGYLRARPDADFVLVLVGDHQPAASVTGPGARWDVPVHVITRRSGVTAALRARGFEPGLGLAGSPAIGDLVELTTMLLRAFDSGSAAPNEAPHDSPSWGIAAP